MKRRVRLTGGLGNRSRRRKIVGWHLSINATVRAMKTAWDKALISEGLLEVIGAPEMPVALSDHGVQMAKKSARQFFKDF